MTQKRSIILIDGSNFYFKLKDLGLHRLQDFNFTGFTKLLTPDSRITKSTYYVGAVKTDGTEKTQHLFNDQRKLLAHLKKHNFFYSLGYLLKSDRVFHEKGVDVNIAVDILETLFPPIRPKVLKSSTRNLGINAIISL